MDKSLQWPSWIIVSILLCTVAVVKPAVTVEDVFALVVMVGLVATVEGILVDKVEEVVTV
jgi:hypothetical protein